MASFELTSDASGTFTHEPADEPPERARLARPLAEFMQCPLTSSEASVYIYESWNGES